ncbi:MAG TPA: hypothetical protein VLS44_03420 [Nitrospira sp.]|nr:hypothetical protein [Nitrospira sp.]
MLPIASSKTESAWDGVGPLSGPAGEDNLAWLRRATQALTSQCGEALNSQELVRLVLVGGTDPVSFRLRVAQAHIRHDLTPSSWSHVVLIHPDPSRRVYEISLEPRGGFRYPVPTNGLQLGTIEHYRDRAAYPNIALLGIPSGDTLVWAKIRRAVHQFQKQRTLLDAMELIVRWLGFVWGAGRAGNPLLEGYGIPSSAMLEIVFSALGHDLTPGLESRSSCPEAIWQAVKWWHEYYGEEGRNQPRCLHRVDHQLVPAAGEGRRSEGPTRPQARASRSLQSARPPASTRKSARARKPGASS